MRKIGFTMGLVCLAAAVGCGGPKPAPHRAEPPVGMNESVPAEEQPTLVVAGTDEEMPRPEAVEAAPIEPPKPPPVVAIADMTAVKDSAVLGAVTFEQGDDGMVTIAGQFFGLKPGKHAFYVHERGDCGSKGKRIGNHLNPTKAKHGPPASSNRHVGDFGNVEADASGNANFLMRTDSLTMVADRPDSVLNRAIVIHAKADDKKGSGGAVLACGVISLKESAQ